MRIKKPLTSGIKPFTKITAKFFTPMWVDFDRQVEWALLRRDAFLDRMIAGEVEHLRNDLEGERQSNKARKYVSDCLKSLGGKSAPPLTVVSISVRKTTADALNKACSEHNVVRDAFLNRLVALLRSSDSFLNLLDLPKRLKSARHDGTEDMPTSPLKAIEEVQSDPLYYLRSACFEHFDCGLYRLAFPAMLDALACYMDDESVPGTEKEKELTEALGFLDSFEASFAKAKKRKGA